MPRSSVGSTTLQADFTGWKPPVDAGQLRLSLLADTRASKNWPDTPTLKELGYPFVFDSPFGLAGPEGMDPAHVQKLHDAFKLALEDAGCGDRDAAQVRHVSALLEHGRLHQVRR